MVTAMRMKRGNRREERGGEGDREDAIRAHSTIKARLMKRLGHLKTSFWRSYSAVTGQCTHTAVFIWPLGALTLLRSFPVLGFCTEVASFRTPRQHPLSVSVQIAQRRQVPPNVGFNAPDQNTGQILSATADWELLHALSQGTSVSAIGCVFVLSLESINTTLRCIARCTQIWTAASPSGFVRFQHKR